MKIQQKEKKPVVIFSDEPEEVLAVKTDETDTESKQYEEKDARKLYNQALEKFNAKSWAEASRLFQESRRLAGSDAIVRFNSTYNLGWVDVKTADEMLDQDPATALD